MTVTSLTSLGRNLRQGLAALAMVVSAALLPAPVRAADIGLPNIVLVHGAFADG